MKSFKLEFFPDMVDGAEGPCVLVLSWNTPNSKRFAKMSAKEKAMCKGHISTFQRHLQIFKKSIK